jgi:hypothetical protein
VRQPITVAAWSEAWNVFARSNAGIAGSNPTQGMDVCLCLFCVCIGSGLVTDWSPIQGVLTTVLGLRNWSEAKSFTDALCSKVGATGKRERGDSLFARPSSSGPALPAPDIDNDDEYCDMTAETGIVWQDGSSTAGKWLGKHVPEVMLSTIQYTVHC